jgi:hypothetical protein
MTTTVETRPATEKEKTVFTAWIEKTSILTASIFGPGRNQFIGLFFTPAILVVVMALQTTPILSLLFFATILFSTTVEIVIIMWSIRNHREIQAGLIADAAGRISRVYRKIGGGGLVTGILIDGVKYHVMDAEPVSEGTMVKIAFLPRTRWIVTLERVYKS